MTSNRNPISIRRFVLAGLALSFAWSGMVTAQQKGADGPPPVPVETSTALSDQFAASLDVPGTVISRYDARIASEISGRITWVAEVGAIIEKGEPIAAINDQDFQLQLRDAQARLRSLEAQRNYQQNQLDRLKRLAQNNNASVTQIDEAQSQLDITVQNIAQAAVAKDQAMRQIHLTKVLAPFSGQVVDRLIQIGEFVNVGSPVARLVDTQHKEIRAQAPLAVAPYIRAGMTVNVTMGGHQALSEVTTVIPVGDDRSRMFEVRLAADEDRWIVGSAVRVALPNSDPRELVAIPRDALVMRGGDVYVYKVVDDSTAQRIDVQTGIGIGDLVEVIGDVFHGDQLITRGAERLQPGQSVTVTPREDSNS